MAKRYKALEKDCNHQFSTFWNGRYFECSKCGKNWDNEEEDRPCFCGKDGDLLIVIHFKHEDVCQYVCESCISQFKKDSGLPKWFDKWTALMESKLEGV